MGRVGGEMGLLSQKLRVSEIFRTVHSNFGGPVKNDPKLEDIVVITSSSRVVRKKPLLVIGDFAHSVAPGGGNQIGGGDPVPGCSSVNAADLKKRDAAPQAATQTAQRGSRLRNPASENPSTGRSIGGAAKEAPRAGGGTKRKADDPKDGMCKRIVREVPLPTKPATRKEPESHVKVSVKRVDSKQDRVSEQEGPAFAVPDSLKRSSKADVNRHREQAPPSRSSVDSTSQDGPARCQMQEVRVGINTANKEGKELESEIDCENCTTSGRRHRKDTMLLGDSHWSLPVDLNGDLFSSKLREVLCKPFNSYESLEMWNLATRRKPVLKLRQTRGRTVHVPSKHELGLSYLDHHPDFAQRIKASSHPAEKLALLRSFFFWLQHSCMEGAFKPWAPEAKKCTQEGDCVLTDGLDCEVLAVVLPLDEKKEGSTPPVPVIIDLSDDDE